MQQVETQDPVVLASRQPYHIQALRAHLMRRLTEKQYRRVSLLYGFDGPPMSQREVAEAEGVDRRAVLDSKRQVVGRETKKATDRLVRFVAGRLYEHWPEKNRETVLGYAQLLKHRMGERWVSGQRKVKEPGKLSADGYLWLLWVVGTFFILRERGLSEVPRQEDAAVTQEEVNEVLTRRGGRILDSRGGQLRWDSDRFTPRSPYDRAIDRLTDEFENGSITRVEYDRDMVVALARQQHPRLDDRDDVDQEFKQKLEWAFGARELGAITSRECDRRVSAALRSYVGR